MIYAQSPKRLDQSDSRPKLGLCKKFAGFDMTALWGSDSRPVRDKRRQINGFALREATMATDSTAGRDFSGQESGTNALQPATGEAFRNAIARLPSGVNIVTTAGSAGKAGFAAFSASLTFTFTEVLIVCRCRA